MPREINDQMLSRMNKRHRLQEIGVNPYPHSFSKTHSSRQLFERRNDLEESEQEVSCAGRVVRYNRKGKVCFLHIKDEWGKIQAVVSSSEVGEKQYEVAKLIDLGDWVGVSGRMFTTKTGEYSIWAKQILMLSKALRPLPVPKEKRMPDGRTAVFDEFTDIETRYRQRYVDLALNDGVRELFRQRAAVIAAIRSYLTGEGYIEVETPILQPIYGGANARPFTTHHHAAGMDMYLRISDELYLKRCIIGGFEKVFEFAKDFRNEGIDRTHYPEFTLLEFYEAFADYRRMMERVEAMFEVASVAVHGRPQFTCQGAEVDVSPPWPRKRVTEAIREYTRIEVDRLDDERLEDTAQAHGIEVGDGMSRGRKIISIFEGLVAPHLIQPHIIFDFPKESTPLCKAHREDPELIEQFEVYIGGLELCNAYSEQNDPLMQREMLERQAEQRRGDDAHPVDEDFLYALESGMPPTGGVGVGIDRMVMLLTDSASIRDVVLFPLMKPG